MGEKKKSKKKIIVIVVLLLIVALVIGVVYYSKMNSSSKGSKDITTEELTTHSIVSSVSGTGVVTASSTEEVYAEISGYEVKEVCVSEGDMISAGDIICILDVTDVEEQRTDLTEDRDEAVSEKEEQDADYDDQLKESKENRSKRLDDAMITLNEKKEAYDNAVSDYSYYSYQYEDQKKELIDAGISESAAEARLSTMSTALHQKKSTMEAAEAELKNAQDQVDAIKDENDDSITDAKETYDDNAQDTIDTYNDNIENLDETIGKAVVRSTISGAVTEVYAEEGRTLNGTKVALIEGMSGFYVEANIDEYDVADVQNGMTVVMKTDATRDEELTGKVTYVALKASESSSSGSISEYSSLLGGDFGSISGSSNTGDASYTVRISFDEQNERLRLGMNVQVSIITEEADDVLAVPYEYIHEREDGTTYIEVVDEENSGVDEEGNPITRTKEIDVTKGLEGSYYTEISSPDLVEGMQVVVPTDDSSQSVDELLNMVGNAGGV